MRHSFTFTARALSVAILLSAVSTTGRATEPGCPALWTAPDDGPQYAVYCVAFYNQENLFDTIHDQVTEVRDGEVVVIEDKNDYEYLPDGANRWTSERYLSKLGNMAYAISQIAIDRLPMGPALIGLSEVENARVLDDLVNHEALRERGLRYVHVEGEDQRGIDVAALYNPRLFKYDHCRLVPYVYPPEDGGVHKTRGFLIVSGQMAGEPVHVIVNHWPSRGATSPARERAGRQVRALVDSLRAENADAKVIVMGDLNDDPDNKSVSDPECLGAKRKQKDVGDSDLWNPWWDTLRKQGIGSLKYDGLWNLFDQIILSGNIVGGDGSQLTYYTHEVFAPAFLMQDEGAYKGYPKRTFQKGAWLNGYSDHLPTIVYLKKRIDPTR